MPLMSPSVHTQMMNSNPDLLDALHAMVSKVLTDEQILDGLSITSSGMEKIAKRLDLTVDETYMLFNSLVTKLRDDREQIDEMLREFDNGPRYSYEQDFLGNVVIRDTGTGKETAVRGSKAQKLVAALENSGNAQAILARYMGLMENETDNEADHADALKKTGFWGKQGAGCIILARSTGRFLIAHRSADVEQPNTWGTWGGAIDANENPVDAVQREVGEEAGYHGKVEKVVPLYVFKKDDFRYSNFLVVVEDEFEPTLNWESQGADWFEFGQWPSPLHFGLKSLLNDGASVTKIKNERTVKEAVTESVLTEDSYDDEIRSASGSFNFPWKVGADHGFGTARFSGRGDAMQIKVVHVRNQDGDAIKESPLLKEIEKQAWDFIGDE